MAVNWEANQQNPGRKDGSRTLLYSRGLSIIYGICMLFLKASLLLQTIELFAQLQDFFYWSCHCVFLMTFCLCAAITSLKPFACGPILGVYTSSITGLCFIDTGLLDNMESSFNLVSSAIILALPNIRIWRMNTTLRARIIASAIFSIGILCVCIILPAYFSPIFWFT
jgi:hypothetical protein